MLTKWRLRILPCDLGDVVVVDDDDYDDDDEKEEKEEGCLFSVSAGAKWASLYPGR